MTDDEIESQATALADSTAAHAIAEWLRSWIDMQPGHSQYHMRDDQIKIGNLALKKG